MPCRLRICGGWSSGRWSHLRGGWVNEAVARSVGAVCGGVGDGSNGTVSGCCVCVSRCLLPSLAMSGMASCMHVLDSPLEAARPRRRARAVEDAEDAQLSFFADG